MSCAPQFLFCFIPNLCDQSLLFIGPHRDFALEGLRDCHPPRYHCRVWFNHVSTLVDFFGNVEGPHYSGDVEVQRLFRDMNTWTNPSTRTVRKVVPLVGISNIDV